MSKSPVRDIIVLDTSVILYDSTSIKKFEGYDIVIPLVVLDEVDKFRSYDSEVGRNARSFIRSINSLLTDGGNLSEGVKRLPTGEMLSIRYLEYDKLIGLDRVLNLDKNDDKILAVCLDVIASNKKKKVSLITKDICLLAKANVLSIACEDYNVELHVKNPSELYTGIGEIIVPSHFVDKVFNREGLEVSEIDPEWCKGFSIYENMGIMLIDETNPSHTALSIHKNGILHKLKYNGKPICGVKPQNREQHLAFELMLDPEISLVSMAGIAGTGKTLLSVACAVHMAIDKNMYDRLLISRPIQPMGKDIGYLPGPSREKVDPYMGPIRDAIEFIFSGNRHKMEELEGLGLLEVEPLTYIRGRSLPRTLFILDEAQGLSPHEMKTLITRIGKESKLLIVGDLFQIDAPYLNIMSNGLTHAIEKFKPYRLSGHITLTRGQRSDLASLAAEIL